MKYINQEKGHQEIIPLCQLNQNRIKAKTLNTAQTSKRQVNELVLPFKEEFALILRSKLYRYTV